MLLTDKVIIVTGGARGIGAAICRVLAREGAKVIVNYSASEDKAFAVVREIKAPPPIAMACKADVCKYDHVGELVQIAVNEYGRIDGYVNNAIQGRQNGSIGDSTDDDYDNAFAFGCHAIVNSARATRPHFAMHGGGRIVNIVTELWNSAPPEWSVYLAGKGAMVGVSRSLAAELGPENITVNMVAPGWMVTETVDIQSDGSRSYATTVPLRKQGDATEIGNVCAFLLSDLAGYVNGAYIPVTGGRVTQMGG